MRATEFVKLSRKQSMAGEEHTKNQQRIYPIRLCPKIIKEKDRLYNASKLFHFNIKDDGKFTIFQGQ
jgi:hypothetical protein